MVDKAPKAAKVTPPEEPKAKAKTTSRKPPGRPTALETQLEELFTFVGIMVSNFNQRDGEIVVQNSKPLAKAWADLAKEDKRVKAALDRLTTGSAWGQVIFVTGGMAFAIAQNHGAIPGGFGIGADGGAEGYPAGDAAAPPPPPRPPTVPGHPPRPKPAMPE